MNSSSLVCLFGFISTKMERRNSKSKSKSKHYYSKNNIRYSCYHNLFNNLSRFSKIRINTVRKTINIPNDIKRIILSMLCKFVPINPARVAKIAESMVINNFATPISSIISLYPLRQYFLYKRPYSQHSKLSSNHSLLKPYE